MKNYFLFLSFLLSGSFASAVPLQDSFCTETGYFVTKTTPAKSASYNDQFVQYSYLWKEEDRGTTYKLFIRVNLEDSKPGTNRYAVYLQKVVTEGSQRTASLNYTGINKEGQVSVLTQTSVIPGTGQIERVDIEPGHYLERTTQGENAELIISGIQVKAIWRNVVCDNTTIAKMPYQNVLMDGVARLAAQLNSLYDSDRSAFYSAFERGFDAQALLRQLWKSEQPRVVERDGVVTGADRGKTVEQLHQEIIRQREREDEIQKLAEKLAEELERNRKKNHHH